MLYRIVLLIILIASGALAAPAGAIAQRSPAEIKKMLQTRDAEIKRILGNKERFTDQQRQTLKDLVNGVIDFESMGSGALGPHWNPLTPEQRKQFVDVFSDIVRGQSLSNLDVYRSPVTYGDITVTGDSARVLTSTIYKDVPARVEYKMIFRNGGWHVTDIILDDVSTAEGYARSFQSVVRKKGFDALMSSLVKRRDKENSKTS